MKVLHIILTGLLFCFFSISSVWAAKDCSFNPGSPEIKNHLCEVLEAEDRMIHSATDMVQTACGGKNSKSCDNALRRMDRLKVDVQKTHEENDVLEESDYSEMIEAAYKGKGKKRDNDEKSCQAKGVDPEDLIDFLVNLEVQDAGSSCFDCLQYFSAKDQGKAEDDTCNNWKVKVIDEIGSQAGIMHVSERQEQLCPTECKGKDKLVDDKKKRFHDNLSTAIEEITMASEEMEEESLRLASAQLAATIRAIEPDDCVEKDTEQPVSAAVLAITFTALNVTEWVAEVCEPPANQDVAGFNAAAVCLVPVTALQIAKEVYDIMNLLNDEFQGEQVTHIQECIELMNTKLDDMGSKIDEINDIVHELRELMLTPQGLRQSGNISWPNK